MLLLKYEYPQKQVVELAQLSYGGQHVAITVIMFQDVEFQNLSPSKST